MTKALLVTLADANYVPQVKQLFSSVYHNSGWKGDYMLLAQDVPEKELKWFEERGILIKRCKPLHDRAFKNYPVTILNKFYLFTEEFKKWDVVVFLDGDITVEASLDRLLKVKKLSAVVDVSENPLRYQFHKRRRSDPPRIKELYDELGDGYDLGTVSFNVGVLAIPTKIIRPDTFKGLLKVFKRYWHITPFPEQAVMNIYFYKRWERLPLVFNLYYQYYHPSWTITWERSEGIVNHFIIRKPWKARDVYFTPKWERNLKKADRIDLNDRPGPKKIWSEEEIRTRSRFIEDKAIQRTFWGKFLRRIVDTLERVVGRTGILLKRNMPILYARMKRMRLFQGPAGDGK